MTAANERTHQRQLAAELLDGWVADLDACRSHVLAPATLAALLHAYSHSGQVLQVLRLMHDAFGCRPSPGTAAFLGLNSSSSSDSSNNSSSSASGGSGDTLGRLQAEFAEQGSGSSSSSSAAAAAEGDAPPSSSSSGGGGGGGGSSSSAPAGAACAGPLSRETLEQAALSPSVHIFNAAIAACMRVGHMHMADGVALLGCMLVRARAGAMRRRVSVVSCPAAE